jgi:hypothetical protein
MDDAHTLIIDVAKAIGNPGFKAGDKNDFSRETIRGWAALELFFGLC